MAQAQGQIFQPAVESYFNRGANGGLTCWYTGAANQTAHTTNPFTFGNLQAYPVVLDGGIIDTVAFEVTSGTPTAVARCGIYRTTVGGFYPDALIVDGGEQDCSTATVKSTSGLSIAISPGIYWFAYIAGVATPTIRALAAGSLTHMMGLPTTMGSGCNTRFNVSRAYGALPTTFPASGALSVNGGCLVAVHYAS